MFARVLKVDDHRAILLDWLGAGRLKLGVSVGGHTGYRVAQNWQKQAFFNIVRALEAAGVPSAPGEPRLQRFFVDFADMLQDHPPNAPVWRAFAMRTPGDVAKDYLGSTNPPAELHFASPDAALEFARTITPVRLAEGQAVVGVVEDVNKVDEFGLVAVVKLAAAEEGVVLAAFANRDTLSASATIGCLCALVAGPRINPRPFLIVAELNPTFSPASGQWKVKHSFSPQP